MARTLTNDHILYDECIEFFRRQDSFDHPIFSGKSYSILLTSFKIDETWDLGICQVSPSVECQLPGSYSAFISRVENPDWVGTRNSHLFGIALSTIFSAVTLKPCKSTRDDFLSSRSELSEYDINQLAILHPILVTGPGSYRTKIPISDQNNFKSEIIKLIEKLFEIEYKKYCFLMQSLRLIHLSVISKREDFGLAYLLAVSSIESIAQKAVTRNSVKNTDRDELAWEEKAKKDPLFFSLLELYRTARGKNEYLRERFVKFIEIYAPIENWSQYVPHPMDGIFGTNKDHEHLLRKHPFEYYPSDLNKDQINSLLSDAYKYRSKFVHRGIQPPHTEPNSMVFRFFQQCDVYEGTKLITILVPNYELMLAIAKNSILNWLLKGKGHGSPKASI